MEENRAGIVDLLISRGAKLELAEVNGITPSSKAGWREHWDILKALKRAGALCQPEDFAGAWLYKKCTELKP